MSGTRGWHLAGVLIAALLAAPASADPRTWTDASGQNSITAELIAVQGRNVVLRESNGQQRTIPLSALSQGDQEFVAGLVGGDAGPVHGPRAETAAIATLADEFFSELRSEKREALAEMITAKAQELLQSGKSPIAKLPTPDEGRRTIRPGRAKIDGESAEIPVQVRVGGKMHKTKLHLRQEADAWRVCALSAVKRDGDTMIDFESESADNAATSSHLDALVGKPFPLVGVTMEGRPVDIGQLKGKPVLVLFWSSTSPSSLAEMPNVLDNHKKYRKDGLVVLTVNEDQELDTLARFMQAERPPWPVIVDSFSGPKDSMAARYGIRDLPVLVLVGADGNVVAVNCKGESLGEKLEEVFAPEKKAESESESAAADAKATDR